MSLNFIPAYIRHVGVSGIAGDYDKLPLTGDCLVRKGFVRRSVCENQYNTEQYNDQIITKFRCAKTLFVHEKFVCIIFKVDAIDMLHAHITKDAAGR